MSRSVVLMAPAKINLTLEVLDRRADGYHDLASVLATIDLRDRVRVTASRELDVRIAPHVNVRPGEDLATKAVRALADASRRSPKAHVRVKKRIPIAAGLGGGSSDAGAVLRGLARVWRLDGLDLGATAARIGSDVPFFATGAAYALVGGRGEHVEPLPEPAIPLWIALVRVDQQLATADVFAAHRLSRSDGERTAALARTFRDGTVTPAIVRAHLTNDLLATAERLAPSIATTRQAATRVGIDLAMSGSGPSLFAVANDRAHALRMVRRLRRAGLRAHALAMGVIP